MSQPLRGIHESVCACYIDPPHPDIGQAIHFCPLHAQAPAMKEALEAIIYASDGCQGHRDCTHSVEPWQKARALLKAIEP